MATIPGDVDADRGPPPAIPLRHFVAALGFLLAGSALGVADAFVVAAGLARLAHLHLLLVGFVCLTIAGAMTQFVPVWSGTALYSRRLDVRDLPPPEPLQLTLETLADLDEDGVVVQVNDRVPQRLFPQLADRGFAYEVIDDGDPVLTGRWRA